MTPSLFLLPVCLALASPADGTLPDKAVMQNCTLTLAQEAQIPRRKPAC